MLRNSGTQNGRGGKGRKDDDDGRGSDNMHTHEPSDMSHGSHESEWRGSDWQGSEWHGHDRSGKAGKGKSGKSLPKDPPHEEVRE